MLHTLLESTQPLSLLYLSTRPRYCLPTSRYVSRSTGPRSKEKRSERESSVSDYRGFASLSSPRV